MVSLSGNALYVINEVEIRRVRLVPGWVTVFGRLSHLGAEPITHVYTAWPSVRG